MATPSWSCWPLPSSWAGYVNPIIYNRKELAKRIKNDEEFITRVLSQPKFWLIGGEDDLRV
jgi:hypothetical protein